MARRSNVTPLEHDEQVGFCNWMDARFPGVRYFAIPNGEKRSISVAKRLKAEGVKSGVPDMMIPAWWLWVEMKRQKGGRVSDEQKDWIDYLRTIGYTVIIAKGATDASRQVMDFLRERGKI